jgi:hypothetical protein
MSKNLKFKIVSIFIGLFFAFLIVEIAYRVKLRYFGSHETHQKTKEFVKYSENEKLLVDLIPNAEVEINNTLYKTNSFGYRDDEWNLADTTQVKVGLISDSVGFPFALNKEEGYEHFTEQLAAQDSLNLNVLNFSLNGYNALQYIEVLKKTEEQNIALDYLVANITSNDSQPTGKPSMLSWIDHPDSGYEWIPSKLIKRAIEAHYRSNVHTKMYSFEYIEQYIDYLKEYQTKRGTRVVILLIPSKESSVNEDYYQKVKAYALSKDFEVIFPKEKFDEIRTKEDINDYFYPDDKMHLSKKGHFEIGAVLSDYFKQTLQ